MIQAAVLWRDDDVIALELDPQSHVGGVEAAERQVHLAEEGDERVRVRRVDDGEHHVGRLGLEPRTDGL